MKHKNFCLCERSELRQGTQVLPGVWVSQRKRRIPMQEVHKWKGRLNLDGSKQIKGTHHDQTCALVVSWSTMCLPPVLALSWDEKQDKSILHLHSHKLQQNNLCTWKCPKDTQCQKGIPWTVHWSH